MTLVLEEALCFVRYAWYVGGLFAARGGLTNMQHDQADQAKPKNSRFYSAWKEECRCEF